MKRFRTPEAGETITLTTRYRSWYRYDDKDYDEFTYTDVKVLPKYDWMTREEFRVKDLEKMGHNIILTDRVINVKNIVEMTGDNVEVVEIDDAVVGFYMIDITSKRTGEVYKIQVVDGVGTKCTCKGFSFRHRCSHLAAAVKVLRG